MDYFKNISLVPVVVAWGFLVLACFIGYGALAARFLKLETQPWPIASVFGLAVLIPIGGVLNFFSSSGTPAIFVLLAAGVWLGKSDAPAALRETAASLRGTFQEGSPWVKALAAAALAFTLLRLFGEARPWAYFFKHDDDFQAYLTYPIRILQTGAMGDDPYCYRRLSSLGGHSFLQCFFLAALPLKSIRYLDVGVGLLILLGLVAHFTRSVGLPLAQRVAVLFGIAVVPSPDANTTSLLLALSLFFTIFLFLNHFEKSGSRGIQWPRGVGFGILLAAICASKSTLTLGAGLVAATYYLALAARERSLQVLAEAAVAALILGVLLLPWMFLMRHSSGTYFFPYLGRGFEAASYGIEFTDPFAPGMLWTHFWVGILSGWYWPLALLFWARKSWFAQPALLAFMAASVVGVLLLMGGAQCSPYDTFRYAYPYLAALNLAALVLALKRTAQASARWLCGAAMILWLGPALAQPVDTARLYYMHVKTLTFGHAEAELASSGEIASVRAAQNSVPPGATILCRVYRSFLLDFKRNRIFVQDVGGGPSPPPGLPTQINPGALAQYYLDQEIQYLMYGPEMRKGPAGILAQVPTSLIPKVYVRMSELALVLDANLNGIRATHRKLYDDGTNWVVDLKEPAP
jgi:hypothetical protein